LVGYHDGLLDERQRKYVAEYFADYKRNRPSDFLKPRVRQSDVHKTVGSNLDELVNKSERASEFRNVDAATLLSSTYLSFSNYVHSRYPEVMDLYGGDPMHFHLRGMSNTPKDAENLEIVEAFIVAVSNSLRQMVLKFGMREKLRSYPQLMSRFQAGLPSNFTK
jgi:hypothetical protein